MQAAAPQALISKSTEPVNTGKPASGHTEGLRPKIPFHQVLGAKAKVIAQSGRGDPSSVVAALEEALKRTHPGTKAHAPEVGSSGRKTSVTASRKHAEGESQHHTPTRLTQAVAAEEAEEPHRSGAPQEKRKRTTSARYGDGFAAIVLSNAAGLSSGMKASMGARTDPGAALVSKSPPEHDEAAPRLTARKLPEIHVRILDVRTRAAHETLEDSTAATKTHRAAPDREASAPVVAKAAASAENLINAPRRQDLPAPAQHAGALERLREMAGSELTRAAAIVLRDGGGEIKLVLKPESLGSVRIRMNLVDNAIEGRIIVDNPAVKHVFEGSLSSLTRALTAEGFQTASLQVSVSGQGADNGRPDREPAPRVRRVAAAGFEGNIPGIENMSLGDLLVNLFV